MEKSKTAEFMREALKESVKALDNDVPVGAVTVFEGKIISRGHNQVELLKDSTAHAEMIALTSASAHLKFKWLHKCVLYVTLEPCAMCAGALLLSRIDTVVYGARDPKSGAFGSKFDIRDFKLNHSIEVEGGVLEKECALILRKFFKTKR